MWLAMSYATQPGTNMTESEKKIQGRI